VTKMKSTCLLSWYLATEGAFETLRLSAGFDGLVAEDQLTCGARFRSGRLATDRAAGTALMPAKAGQARANAFTTA